MRYVIVVSGGRAYSDEEKIREDLEFFRGHHITLYHGACGQIGEQIDNRFEITGNLKGADGLADKIGRGLGFNVEPVPVCYDTDGPWPGAGPNRNWRMCKRANAEFVGRSYDRILGLLYPTLGSVNRGTTNCSKQMHLFGIKYLDRSPDNRRPLSVFFPVVG